MASKRRLNHPFALAFGGDSAPPAPPSSTAGTDDATALLTAGLPPALSLQTLRANDANGTELILRLAHNFARGALRARSHRRFVLPPIHFIPDLLR